MPASNKDLLQLLLVEASNDASGFIKNKPDIEKFAKWLDCMEYEATEINACELMYRFDKLPTVEFNAEYADDNCMVIYQSKIKDDEFTLFIHTG